MLTLVKLLCPIAMLVIYVSRWCDHLNRMLSYYSLVTWLLIAVASNAAPFNLSVFIILDSIVVYNACVFSITLTYHYDVIIFGT